MNSGISTVAAVKADTGLNKVVDAACTEDSPTLLPTHGFAPITAHTVGILGKCWENTKRIVNVDRECCHEHHEHGHVGPILPYCILLHSGNCLFRMLFFAVISSHPGVMKSIYLCFPLRSIKGWQNKAQRTSREDPVDVAAQCFFCLS